MTWVTQKLFRFSLILTLVFSFIGAGVFSSPVNADAIDGDDGIANLTDRWLRYRAIAGCYSVHDVEGNSVDEVTAGTWLDDGFNKRVAIGYLNEDGKVECADGAFVKNSLSKIGFSSNIQAFCEMTPLAKRGGTSSNSEGGMANCLNGSGEFDMSGNKSEQESTFKSAKARFVTDSEKFPYEGNGAIKYHIGLESLKKFCGGTRGAIYDGTDGNVADSERQVVVNEIDLSTGKMVRYVYGLNKDAGDNISQLWAESGLDQEYTTSDFQVNDKEMSCQELAKLTWTNDDAFATFVKAYNTDNPEDVGSGFGENNPGADSAPICTAGALGWVLCPLSEALVSAIEGIAEILEGLLVYQPLLTSDQGKAIRAIWQSLLVIANVGLVIAILVIVFSQATSVGLSSYGIKKLLPRVVAAAILMNLSFYICAAAVDMSNILGVSIKSIAEAGMSQIAEVSAGGESLRSDAGTGRWIAVITGALIAAAIATATGAIFLLLPVLIAGFMALLTALLIIAARQVLITLLIIVAPLAILAWILPNTDDWFTKWRKLFTILLLMFPLIMAIFYGSILVSSVILTASTDTGSELNDFTITLLAFLVLIVPLFSLPFVMKSVGGILERFGAITNNRGKGVVDRSRKKGEELKGRTSYQRGRGIRQQAKQDFRNKRFAERLNLSNKSLEDFKKENGGTLSTAQMAQWTRAQSTKGLAGGAGEIARMTGRGAMKGVAAIPGDPDGIVGSARDSTLVAGAYAAGLAGKVPGGDMRRAQTEALNRGAQAQEAKAFAERVSAIQTSYDRGGSAGADTSAGGYLDRQYQEAIQTGNHEQAAAVISRLSGLGAGGRNRLSTILKDNKVSDTKMQDTVIKSVMQDNYGSLVGSRADTAKSNGFDSTGAWDTSGALGNVGTGQLATQDEKTLYQNFSDISQAEAAKIMSEPNLESTVQNAKARAILRARESGATSLPTSGLIDPSDPALGSWSDLAK